jgi:transcriptional regulator with XRE-family HTH domain
MSALTLGTFLRQHREGLGFTIRQVEFLTGISSAFITTAEEGKIRPNDYYLKVLAYLYQIPFADLLLATNDEPAATIQAIREATERHTQSGEAAREFLVSAGIEPTPEDVLNRWWPFDIKFSRCEVTSFKQAIKAMQEYADLQTASLQAEKAELVEALGKLIEVIRNELGSPELVRLVRKANALLSKHNR